ncbi:MAG: beta-galactosidase, partial [Ardenticatenaceae bacterium]
ATRALAEAAQLGDRWAVLAEALAGTVPAHDAAILFDFPSHWALELQPHSRSLDFDAESDEPLLIVGDALFPRPTPPSRGGLYCLPVYEALWRNNLQAAIISPDGNFERYHVIFVPQLHIATEAHAARLRAWVEAGGTLVVGPRVGFKNESNALHEQPQPGPLTSLIGGTVREFDTREPGDTLVVDFGDEQVEVGVWCEIWEATEGAEVLATYEAMSAREELQTNPKDQDISPDRLKISAKQRPYYAGMPAVLYNRHGKGQVITLGTMGGWRLIEHLLPQLGLQRPIVTPDNVEAVRRVGPGGNLLFLLNHTPAEQIVSIPGEWVELFEGRRASNEERLAPYGWLVLKQEPNR